MWVLSGASEDVFWIFYWDTLDVEWHYCFCVTCCGAWWDYLMLIMLWILLTHDCACDFYIVNGFLMQVHFFLVCPFVYVTICWNLKFGQIHLFSILLRGRSKLCDFRLGSVALIVFDRMNDVCYYNMDLILWSFEIFWFYYWQYSFCNFCVIHFSIIFVIEFNRDNWALEFSN